MKKTLDGYFTQSSKKKNTSKIYKRSWAVDGQIGFNMKMSLHVSVFVGSSLQSGIRSPVPMAR